MEPDQNLVSELSKFYDSVTPYTVSNKFKAMLYNIAPTPEAIRRLQTERYQPKVNQADYYLVDSQLFEEALLKNPDKSRLYPCQVNSCGHLTEKLKTYHGIFSSFSRTLEGTEKALRETDVKIAGQSSEKLKNVCRRQSELLEKMCRISHKLEILLDSKNALLKDSSLEIKIRSKIESLNRRLVIGEKIKTLKLAEQPSDELNLPDEYLQEVFNIMKEQRKNIAELKNMVSQDIKTVEALEAKKKNRN